MFAQGTPVDLNTWTEESPPGSGNWTVSADGSNVFQSVNNNQTFFVSPNSYFNTTVTGQLRVETTSDDDYIGFLFGYQTPNSTTTTGDWNFLVFDWKQLNQSGSTLGFTLARVDGATCTTECIPFGNHQTSQSGPDWTYEVLATNVGTGLGWADNTTYDFELLYEENRVRIIITGGTGTFQNGLTVFDLEASPTSPLGSLTSFPEGRFAFYNYSQASVRYSSFIQNNGPVANVDTPEVDEDDSVTFNVLTNDTDPDDDPLSITGNTDPSSGMLTDNGSGSFTYTPAPNFFGTDGFTYTVTDGEFSSTGTVTITVNPVNDAPSFTIGSDQTVAQDSGPQSVAGFITGISPGPANESGQVVSFLVSNDNNGLFSAQPAIDGSGTLTYTPAAGQSGSALVTVAAMDDGGTANGGDDTSDPQTFTITIVAPLNNPPVITSLTGDVAGTEGDTFDFMSAATDADPGDVLTYTYDFGDGSPTQAGVDLTMVSHVYTTDGTYTLTLTVTDGNGGSDAETLEVVVSDPTTGTPDVTVTISTSTPTLPASGGILDYVVTVTNNEATPQTLDGWLVLAFPDGRTTQVRPPKTLTFGPGETLQATLSRRIPAKFPPGTYTVTGRVGDMSTGDVYDSDVFTFVKEADVMKAAPLLRSRKGDTLEPDLEDATVDAFELGSGTFESLGGIIEAAVPEVLALVGAHPNPFTSATTLVFDLPEAGPVRLALYDVRGREVSVLVDGSLNAGRHEAVVSGSTLPSGTYVWRLTSGDDVRTGRITRLR